MRAAPRKTELELRWYQTRLGFWQAIWETLITGGIAVAIPAGVNAFKIYQDRKLKEREIALRSQDNDRTYISKFLDTALKPDIEMRIRLSEYFAYISGTPSPDEWKKFLSVLTHRRDEIRTQINQKETQVDKLRAKQGSLSVEEQTQRAQLQRDLYWLYDELGAVSEENE